MLVGEKIPCVIPNWQFKITLYPLHVKLTLIKKFSKSLDEDELLFVYNIGQTFMKEVQKNLKAGIFNRPGVKQNLSKPGKFPFFVYTMCEFEVNAWTSVVLVLKTFLSCLVENVTSQKSIKLFFRKLVI